MAFDAADFADRQGDIQTRHVIARFTQNNGDTFAGVGRAANDLFVALIGRHGADPQAVGIGMLFGVRDLGQCERTKTIKRINDVLNL